MANEQNLIKNSDLTPSERQEKARKAGIASGEARRAKKNMRQTAKMLMEMALPEGQTKESLAKFGVEESDMNYQTAVVTRLMQRAILEGDTSAVRLLGELTGDVTRFGFTDTDDDISMEGGFSVVSIPDNGRDQRKDIGLAPQAGPQTMFMVSPADIVIFGGAAGGGKTYALLLEGLRHKDVDGFGAVIFRHNYNQITAEGGLWDASQKIYSQVPDAQPRKSPKLHWRFGDKAKLNFAHIEREEDLKSWQGTEIAYIGFDELTHFTKHQFLYMLSRNRTTCGVKPYVRATCNPDVDSWVAEFIEWWIDQDTGYPIPEKSGQIRWMVNIEETISWFGTREDAVQFALDRGIPEDKAQQMPKSVTFIASKLDDNKILMEADPGYMANLLALPNVDMERLLNGNWKIKKAAGSFFQRTQVGKMLDEAPGNIIAFVRGWDLAATDKDEDDQAAFTAGVLIGQYSDGRFVVLDVINKQLRAGDVRNLILMTAEADNAKYGYVTQRLPQDPGQAGKEQAQSYMIMLAGYDVVVKPESGDKITRATPMAAQWQHGNFDVVKGEWNQEYFNQLESFPGSQFKDMVDAGSSAFNELIFSTQNRTYKAYVDNPEKFIISVEDAKKMNMAQINVGISMQGATIGVHMVATAILAGHQKAVVLFSQSYAGEVDGETLERQFLDFCQQARDEYGHIEYVYCDDGEGFLLKCIKDAVMKSAFSVSVRRAANDDVVNRIRLTNTLFAQDRLQIVENCQTITKAFSTATRADNKKAESRSNESDNGTLCAFEYTIEREGARFIANK